MKPMSKPNPKPVQLGEDLPWVWGVDGWRGDPTVNEKKFKNVAFITRKECNRSRGPEVQRSRRPDVCPARGRSLDIGRSPRAGLGRARAAARPVRRRASCCASSLPKPMVGHADGG